MATVVRSRDPAVRIGAWVTLVGGVAVSDGLPMDPALLADLLRVEVAGMRVYGAVEVFVEPLG